MFLSTHLSILSSTNHVLKASNALCKQVRRLSVPNPYHYKLERSSFGSAFQNVHCPPATDVRNLHPSKEELRTHTHKHTDTPTHPHPHTHTTAHPHTRTPAHPHTRTPAHPHTHTPTQPHSHTATQPHSHTATQPHTHTPTGWVWVGGCVWLVDRCAKTVRSVPGLVVEGTVYQN